jgi:hypothetical protein
VRTVCLHAGARYPAKNAAICSVPPLSQYGSGKHPEVPVRTAGVLGS